MDKQGYDMDAISVNLVNHKIPLYTRTFFQTTFRQKSKAKALLFGQNWKIIGQSEKSPIKKEQKTCDKFLAKSEAIANCGPYLEEGI